ncbi:hypothetical protein R1sor_023607 [Riccia sorocarpa]|uniref:Myb/SANT-like DNA-binding domain-containing protein n=1 Tax=Riccia sorocarpa TaxID=122646 RepID=A0ABD3GS57_9MARC
MDARRSVGENLNERDFLPVSPSDPIYMHPPPSLTSGSPRFAMGSQFRMPFMMQGMPSMSRFDGAFSVHRPQLVRPLADLNLAAGDGNRIQGGSRSRVGFNEFAAGSSEMAGGNRPGPSTFDYPDSTVPSSQAPLPEDLPEVELVEPPVVQVQAQPPARRRRAAATGKTVPAPREGVKNRFHWHDAATIALIECKKEESDEDDARTGRENILTADQKWKIIEEKMARKNIFVEGKKCSKKWEKLATEFRKIHDYGKWTGRAPYSALDSSQREAEKLPTYFPDQWYQLMESFMGPRPAINPILAESGMNPPPPVSEEEHVVIDGRLPDYTDPAADNSPSASDRNDDGIESTRHNSGKRKKDVSKSATAIVTTMSAFSESFVAVEDKREEREATKQKILVEAEERHFKWLVESEDRREATKAAPNPNRV